MDKTELKKKLFKGSIAGVLRVVIAVPVYIALTPFLLSRLGPSMFGIWSFNSVVINIINLTDFGFKNSLVREVAVNVDDRKEILRYFTAAFWIYVSLNFILMVLIFMFTPVVVSRVINIPNEFHDQAVFVFLITAVSFSLRFIAAPFQAVIEGHQDLYFSQLTSLIWLIANTAGTVTVLFVKPDVYSLGYVSLASNLIVLLMFLQRTYTCYPYLLTGLFQIDRDAVMKMLRFGIGIQFATIIITLREPIYKMLISRYFDLNTLASFEISYRLCTQLMSIVITPLSGAFAVSALLEKRHEELGKILRTFIGYSCAVLIPAILLFGSFSDQIISFWLGGEQFLTSSMTFFMFTGFAVYYVTQPLNKAFEGFGMSWYSAFIQTCGLVVSILLFAALITYGPASISLSLAGSLISMSLVIYIVFKKNYNGVILISVKGLVALLSTSALYAISSLFCGLKFKVVLFGIYVIAHVIIIDRSGILNISWLAGNFFGFGRKKFKLSENV